MALGRYNLDRYNLLPGNDLRYTESYDMYSAVSAAFATSSAISPAYFVSQSLSASMVIGYGYDVRYEAAAELAAVLELDFFISPPYYVEAALSAVMNPHLSISPMYDCDQALSGRAILSYYAEFKQAMAAALSAVMSYDIAHYPSYEAYQALNAQFNMQSMTLTIMGFDDIVIPAGGVLVIDADNCTAYLDNTSVIDLYSGDWIWLTRLLLGVDVSSNTSGDIDVKLLYRERYL